MRERPGRTSIACEPPNSRGRSGLEAAVSGVGLSCSEAKAARSGDMLVFCILVSSALQGWTRLGF